MREVVELEPRAGWLRARQQGIGGSDVGGIMGVSPFGGPLDVYADKVEPVVDDVSTGIVRLGQLLEDGIATYWAERNGATLTKPTHLLAHDTDDWRLASPDRFTDRGILEVKTGHSAAKYADGLPDYIALQCHHYLGVTGADVCDVAVLMHGRDLVEYRVERDDQLLGALRDIEAAFWQKVVDRTPPEPDGLSGRALARMYAKATPGATVNLDSTLRVTIDEYEQAKADEAAAKGRVDRAGNELRAALGVAEIGLLDGDPAVRWSNYEQQRVDLDAIEADNPGLLDLYRRPVPGRRLTIPKGHAR